MKTLTNRNKLFIVILASFLISTGVEVAFYDASNLFKMEFIYALVFASPELLPFSVYCFISYYLARWITGADLDIKGVFLVYFINLVLLSIVLGCFYWYDDSQSYWKLQEGIGSYLLEFLRFLIFAFISATLQILWLWGGDKVSS